MESTAGEHSVLCSLSLEGYRCRKHCTSPALSLTDAPCVWAVLWTHQSKRCSSWGSGKMTHFMDSPWWSQGAQAPAAGITKDLQISSATVPLPFLWDRQMQPLYVPAAFQRLRVFLRHLVRDAVAVYDVQGCVCDTHSVHIIRYFYLFFLFLCVVTCFFSPYPIFLGCLCHCWVLWWNSTPWERWPFGAVSLSLAAAF